LASNQGGDERFYNNLLVGPANLGAYDGSKLPVTMRGNVFLKGAKPGKAEKHPLVMADFDPLLQLIETGNGLQLKIALDKQWGADRTRPLVTTELLGRAETPGLPYVHPDGSAYRIDGDFSGTRRNPANPFPGPFELPRGGVFTLKVWPLAGP